MMRLSRLKSTPQKQLIMIGLPLLLILSWLSVYLGSAWWQAYQLKTLLLRDDRLKIEKQIPEKLLEASQPKTSLAKASPTAMHDNKPASHQPGERYLDNVWPYALQQQDLYRLLILQADANRSHWTHGYFSHFPNTFNMRWGDDEHLMWFEWQRHSWYQWRLSKLCVYNPQPLSTENNCESSSR